MNLSQLLYETAKWDAGRWFKPKPRLNIRLLRAGGALRTRPVSALT